MESEHEKRAAAIVRNLFKDRASGVLTREEIFNKIAPKTFHNYSRLIQDYDYVVADKEEGKGRKIVQLRLTDKGRQALSTPESIRASAAQAQLPLPQNNVLIVPSLDEITKLTDAFNRSSEAWEWKLVRKGVSASK